MNNRRILIIAPTAYLLGGVSVWLDYLLHGLGDAGFEMVFGAVDGDYHDAEKYLERYPFERNIVIKNRSKTAYGRARAISNAVRKINPSLVISANIPDVYRAARDLKKTSHPDLKIVATLHGLLPNFFQDMCQYSDCIDHIVVTNRLTQLMVEKVTPFQIDEISYAPYGVKEQNVMRKRDVGKRARLLYCGRIENEQKRCSDIVKIVDQLARRSIDYELRVAGDGPYKKQFFDELETVKGNGRIIDLGLLNESELISVGYAESDILLLTSGWETGPIVIWEAMAAGLAVVTSRYRGLTAEGALIDQDNCLIFDIGDIPAAVRKLQQCLNDSVYQKIVSGGVALSKSRYSRPSSVAAWGAVFNELCDTKKGFSSSQKFYHTEYLRNGLLEKVFGVPAATHVRLLIGKPAYTASAGDEWPHTHSVDDEAFNKSFYQHLSNIES